MSPDHHSSRLPPQRISKLKERAQKILDSVKTTEVLEMQLDDSQKRLELRIEIMEWADEADDIIRPDSRRDSDFMNLEPGAPEYILRQAFWAGTSCAAIIDFDEMTGRDKKNYHILLNSWRLFCEKLQEVVNLRF